MTAPESNQSSPYVDPSGLSLEIAQKLAQRSSVEYIPPPRLSIAHLFLWTTVSAVIMAIGRTSFRPEQETDVPGSAALETAYWCIMSGLLGLQVTGLCIEAARRWRHGRVPLQPGEWLLVADGAIVVMSFSAFGVHQLFDSLVLLVPFGLGALMVLSIAARRIGAWNAWRWLIITSILAPIVTSLFIYESDARGMIYPAIQAAVWAVAVLRDQQEWPTRNWLHWTGAFTFIVAIALDLSWQIVWVIAMERQ
jgi:hypothetical protein